MKCYCIILSTISSFPHKFNTVETHFLEIGLLNFLPEGSQATNYILLTALYICTNLQFSLPSFFQIGDGTMSKSAKSRFTVGKSQPTCGKISVAVFSLCRTPTPGISPSSPTSFRPHIPASCHQAKGSTNLPSGGTLKHDKEEG